ncbi:MULTISPECIES: Rv3654c family TadE-like protein [unclassified Arthrobacter]|uniref:Rv3654c family TadE-like protein n=1 Tax=unclassified Arthrobacter TaxID=235627 RepID=UPI001D142B91|nr:MULTISPECIES: Rv3654c family TadE-like protein [unclassified Arthrobacter]MCC3275876.1 hypothetical protein [Arthrobacter sp. zg-Y20]MCC3278144.1 hypothetical protein [Arthrobacter sp. zg-Y40]MCC9176537.1 hypothetical protein [Arthrobacter sp. zg-Y750]MDK1316033.1 hypothetical protein [Arthrobacter sp. zg.Y20]WIB05674.1 hypothetical protein QNO06_14275 [Arthrobacter sp. zg-Y20]
MGFRAETPEKAGEADVRDRGAGTVASIGICLVLVGAAVFGLVMVQVSVAAIRAGAAADLAALAGADALRGLGPPGPVGAGASEDACEVARGVAARNNARLADCRADAGRGTVTVRAEVLVPALPVPAAAAARAGPPE